MAMQSVLIDDHIKKGKAALKQQAPDIAISYFETVLQHEPNNVEAAELLWKARILKASAWNVFEKYWALVRAYIFQLLKKKEKARELLELLARGSINNVNYSVLLGNFCIDSGDIDTSLEMYENAVKLQPENIKYLKILGNLYNNVNRFADAVRIYKKLSQLKPDDPKVQKMLKQYTAKDYATYAAPDNLMEKRGESDKAAAEASMLAIELEIQKLIELCKKDPNNCEQRLSLVKKLWEAEHPEEAMAVISSMLDMRPDFINALLFRSEMLLKQGLFDKAIDDLNRVQSLEPDNLDCRRKICEVKIFELESELKKNSDNASLKSELSSWKKKLDIIIAEEYQEILKKNPNDHDTRIRLGDMFMKIGDIDRAISEYQLAAKAPQRIFQTSKRLGYCFTLKNMNEVAIEQFNRALSKAPQMGISMSRDIKEIRCKLSLIYEKMGNLDEAISVIKPVYEEDITFENVKDRFEKLYKNRYSSEKEK